MNKAFERRIAAGNERPAGFAGRGGGGGSGGSHAHAHAHGRGGRGGSSGRGGRGAHQQPEGSGVSIHKFAARGAVFHSKKGHQQMVASASLKRKYASVLNAEEKQQAADPRKRFYDEVFADATARPRLRQQRQDARVAGEEKASDQHEDDGDDIDNDNDNEDGEDEEQQTVGRPGKRARTHKPDPFAKQKKQAEDRQAAIAAKRAAAEARAKAKEDRLQQREQRHKHYTARTAKGQPVMKFAMKHLLDKVKAQVGAPSS